MQSSANVASHQSAKVWAVVPVKHLKDAKQRLSPVLTPHQRDSLTRAMLEDVLSALCQTECLAGVMLVTGDAVVTAVARCFAARVLVERDQIGHSETVTFAAEVLTREKVASMLSVPADLPLVTPDEITALVEAHALPPAVTIAPARDKLGSNAMLCSPPNVLPFRFGENSFTPHLRRARELGIVPRVVERAGLGLDVDTPEDLAAFAANRSRTHAYDYLERSGLIAKLAALASA